MIVYTKSLSKTAYFTNMSNSTRGSPARPVLMREQYGTRRAEQAGKPVQVILGHRLSGFDGFLAHSGFDIHQKSPEEDIFVTSLISNPILFRSPDFPVLTVRVNQPVSSLRPNFAPAFDGSRQHFSQILVRVKIKTDQPFAYMVLLAP